MVDNGETGPQFAIGHVRSCGLPVPAMTRNFADGFERTLSSEQSHDRMRTEETRTVIGRPRLCVGIQKLLIKERSTA